MCLGFGRPLKWISTRPPRGKAGVVHGNSERRHDGTGASDGPPRPLARRRASIGPPAAWLLRSPNTCTAHT